MRLAWHSACIRERSGAYRVLVGKPEGKRPPGTARGGWEDNITMYLQKMEWEHVDWIDLPEDRNM
jgi:hypothetical protein